MAPPPIPSAVAAPVTTVDWMQKVNEAIPWKYVAGAVALVAVGILLHQCVANGDWFIANAKGLVTGTILTLTLAGIGATIFIAKKRWQAWTYDQKYNFCAAVGSIVLLGILLMSAGIYRNWANTTVKQGFSQAGLIVVPLIGLLGGIVASTIWKRKYGHWPHQNDPTRPPVAAPNPPRSAAPTTVAALPPAAGTGPNVTVAPAHPVPMAVAAAPVPATVLPPAAGPGPNVTAPPANPAPLAVAAAQASATVLPPVASPATIIVAPAGPAPVAAAPLSIPPPQPILLGDLPSGAIIGPPTSLPVFIAREAPATILPPNVGPLPLRAPAPPSPPPAAVAAAPVATSPPPLTAGDQNMPIAVVVPQ